MNVFEDGPQTPEKGLVDNALPEFLKREIEDATTSEKEIFEPGVDIYPELAEYLYKNGKTMPENGELPSFMNYVGDGFYTSTGEEPVIEVECSKNIDISSQWKEWFNKCPNISKSIE
ncbi:MAG: hypothetical protein WCL23_03155 [Candidatus Moraniibacteriota bacterium]